MENPPDKEELKALEEKACQMDKKSIEKIRELFNSGASLPESVSSAMFSLMHKCEEINGWGLQACESQPRAWLCLVGALRISVAPEDDAFAHNSPFKEVVKIPEVWPDIRILLDWAEQFEIDLQG